MNSRENDIIQIFKETGALMTGHFVLRSGLHSGHFFQCARVCEYLDRVSTLATWLLEEINPAGDFDTVLAPAMGGLVIGQEVARQAGKRFVFVEKVDDKLALRRGFKFAEGERVLVVEDVITRGGRVREALDIVSANGAQTVGVAVLVDRSEGQTAFGDIPHFPLLRFSFPTFPADKLPPELAAVPVTKPGS